MSDQADIAPPDVQVNTYDAVPYSVGAFPQTHPNRLATIARLFGMSPTHPDECRVLELGCAAGGNLIPMALASPRSRFVGIDLSKGQIDDGQEMVRELGVSNIELRHLSILDVPRDLGEFDYILVHGVYSWVPPEVQDKILEIGKRHLAPMGVTYISYNAYPGWHARGAIREMLWYHTQRFSEPAERIREARGLLAFLAQSLSRDGGGYSRLLCQELLLLMRTPETYLLHEHLEEFNEPLYFHQFIQRCAAKGLEYLGEAQISTMVAGSLGAQTEETLRKISPSLLHMEQYMDFVRNRMFRQTVLCHEDIELERALRPEAVMDLYVGSAVKPVSENPNIQSTQEESFKAGGPATLTTHDPVMKAAMVCLSKVWPLSMAFAKLLEDARRTAEVAVSEGDGVQLAARLLNCYVSGLAELYLAEPKFVVQVSKRPVASSYARLRARAGKKITNMKLETVMLGEPSRQVIQQLDGRHDREGLIEFTMKWMREKATADASPPERERAAEYIDRLLPTFAKAALLIE